MDFKTNLRLDDLLERKRVRPRGRGRPRSTFELISDVTYLSQTCRLHLASLSDILFRGRKNQTDAL